ncbi:MAG: GNAT family N-acetyltransferase [Polyangiaceae bacterium]
MPFDPPPQRWRSRRRSRKNLNQSRRSYAKFNKPRGVPSVLAYEGATHIGWCSIAPRETYIRLEKSKTMPRVTPPETPTWSVLCSFVARRCRGQRVSQVLLEGAVAWARLQGAKIVEGYPFDTAGISSTHRGHSHVFEATRFQSDANRWSRRLRGR